MFAPLMSLFGLDTKAEAAELTPEQLQQQAAMERGETVASTTEMGELPALDTESFAENIFSQLESIGEVAAEIIGGLGTSIVDGFYSAFESVGAVVGELGAMISEGLTAVIEGAGEAFSGLGDLIGGALETASSIASSALTTIQSAFTATKDAIQSAWSEVPGFFEGVFSGLGGAAAAAGSAILSGLTSVCGAVIGAWQGVASTVSGIIASIAAAAANVGSMIPSFGGGGTGKAEGGFVSSETHYFAGEHGPEVIIPLSPTKHNRAMKLLQETAAIIGGEAFNFSNDKLESDAISATNFDDLGNNKLDGGAISATNFDELGNRTDIDIPEYNKITADDSLDVRRAKLEAQQSLNGDVNVKGANSTNNSNEINMGGVNVSFDISGSENPQEVMQTIKENLNDLTEKMAAQLSEKIGTIFANQPLEG